MRIARLRMSTGVIAVRYGVRYAKVCKFYHADAPAGTTGVRTSLNRDSDELLTKLGAFRPYMSSSERLRLDNKRRR